jgi:hypothetical protein
MESKTKLKLGITIAATLTAVGGWIAYRAHKKKQDREAALFFSELERNISPGSVGLVETDAFKINYWKDLILTLKKSYSLIKIATAKGYADTIYNAWSVFGDNEEQLYGVFRALKDQVAVSQIANQYYLARKINLIDDLIVRLSKEEVGVVQKIVDKLPPYRLA